MKMKTIAIAVVPMIALGIAAFAGVGTAAASTPDCGVDNGNSLNWKDNSSVEVAIRDAAFFTEIDPQALIVAASHRPKFIENTQTCATNNTKKECLETGRKERKLKSNATVMYPDVNRPKANGGHEYSAMKIHFHDWKRADSGAREIKYRGVRLFVGRTNGKDITRTAVLGKKCLLHYSYTDPNATDPDKEMHGCHEFTCWGEKDW